MSQRPCYLEFDEKRLRDLIRCSSPRSLFWKLLKAELTQLRTLEAVLPLADEAMREAVLSQT